AWLLEAAQKLAVPLVDTALSDVAVPYRVSVDNAAIGRLAAAHLSQAGLKHFGYCGVRGRLASEQRRDALAACLPGRNVHAFAEPVSEGELGLEPLMRWLRRQPRPIGLLTFDDKLGERVLTACRWAELKVPQEVAV